MGGLVSHPRRREMTAVHTQFLWNSSKSRCFPLFLPIISDPSSSSNGCVFLTIHCSSQQDFNSFMLNANHGPLAKDTALFLLCLWTDLLLCCRDGCSHPSSLLGSFSRGYGMLPVCTTFHLVITLECSWIAHLLMYYLCCGAINNLLNLHHLWVLGDKCHPALWIINWEAWIADLQSGNYSNASERVEENVYPLKDKQDFLCLKTEIQEQRLLKKNPRTMRY